MVIKAKSLSVWDCRIDLPNLVEEANSKDSEGQEDLNQSKVSNDTHGVELVLLLAYDEAL